MRSRSSMRNHQHKCLRDLIWPRGHTTRFLGSTLSSKRTLSNAATVVRWVYKFLWLYSWTSIKNSSLVRKSPIVIAFVLLGPFAIRNITPFSLSPTWGQRWVAVVERWLSRGGCLCRFDCISLFYRQNPCVCASLEQLARLLTHSLILFAKEMSLDLIR